MSTQGPEGATTDLVLTPPTPIQAVATAQAEELVGLDAEARRDLDEMVEGYVDTIARLEPDSEGFTEKVNAVHAMGAREIRESAGMSNRMLERPVKAMDTGIFDARSPVARSLVDLRKTVDDLDPSKQDLFSPRKILGIIPFGDKIHSYFLRFQSAQSHLDRILQALYHGQDELRQDNAAVEQEKVNLWAVMERLRRYAYLAGRIDAAIAAKATHLESGDPAKAKALREDVLFYVRQKHQDLLTQLAVSAQGYLALDMIRRNNLELVKGVDRATTTTVSALRTAVMVAQALANQKLVLDQITALNTTTGDLIESTSEMLREQTGRVHEQAASSTIEIDRLKAAFANIYATIDAIDTFKARALQTMGATVEALTGEISKAQEYLERSEAQAERERAGGDLQLPG